MGFARDLVRIENLAGVQHEVVQGPQEWKKRDSLSGSCAYALASLFVITCNGRFPQSCQYIESMEHTVEVGVLGAEDGERPDVVVLWRIATRSFIRICGKRGSPAMLCCSVT